MKIGFAQVIVHHEQLTAAINLGILVAGIFTEIEQDMDIDHVSVGITPNLAGTWFVFTGAMR
jgi:hypothetical protein